MESRQLSLNSETWKMIDAMCGIRDLSTSKLIESLVAKVATFDANPYIFDGPVNTANIAETLVEHKDITLNIDTGGAEIHSLQTGDHASYITGQGSNVNIGEGDLNVGQQTFSIEVRLPENVDASKAAISQMFSEFTRLLIENPNVNLTLPKSLAKKL
ncbi:hypothetical protein N9Y42_01480 [Mariniblastus sp.]|nr:hypothetical protein [Mariniblastus sp.]